MKLHQLMGIDGSVRVTSLLGGGGKTTALYALAREAAAAGRRTVLLTTTHIFPPQEADVRLFCDCRPVELERVWQQGMVLAVGSPGADGRLAAPPAELWNYVYQRAQAIYIEADGSKGLPLKYPAEWEPALLPQNELSLLLCGLSALDRPFDDYCHRAALARRELGLRQQLIDEALMARVLAAGYGRFQPRVIINQADTPQLVRRGQLLSQLLAEQGLDSRVLSLQQLAAGRTRRQ